MLSYSHVCKWFDALDVQFVQSMRVLSAGDSVTPVVSNIDSYAHWSWQHPSASATAGNDCVYAGKAYQYDFFTGDNQNATQRGSNTFFQRTGTKDLKNGWTASACDGSYPSVCLIAVSSYPCSPPPSPPPPPPRPPSPPSPPQPVSCKHLSFVDPV